MKSMPCEQQEIHGSCFHPTGTFVEFAKDELEQCVTNRFEKIVGRYPHHLAIKTRNQELTYDQLNRMANRVGHLIRTTRDERERPIAIMVESGALWITSILGVLKSGNWFVTSDASHPGVVLTHRHYLHQAMNYGNCFHITPDDRLR